MPRESARTSPRRSGFERATLAGLASHRGKTFASSVCYGSGTMAVPREGSFVHLGRRISYLYHGSGPRVLVLTHGLLMDRRMYDRVAPAVAERGFRVICV